LFAPLATDRRGEVPAGAKPYFEIPVFNCYGGHLSVIYQRQYIDSAARFADAPRLDAQTVQALDLFDALSNDPALHFTMALQPGDMQFIHNHVLLHDRTAFDDWPQPERRRHLLRLWLAPERGRPLPPVYAQRYGSVVPGQRGGVPSAGGRLQWTLDLLA
jgi:alpha-ketoglutarate-dependent taurine dioxygenase